MQAQTTAATDTRHAAPTMDTPATAELAATAPGGLRVIRRNGKVTTFDASKINIALTKAFPAVEGGNAAASPSVPENVERPTQHVGQASLKTVRGDLGVVGFFLNARTRG